MCNWSFYAALDFLTWDSIKIFLWIWEYKFQRQACIQILSSSTYILLWSCLAWWWNEWGQSDSQRLSQNFSILLIIIIMIIICHHPHHYLHCCVSEGKENSQRLSQSFFSEWVTGPWHGFRHWLQEKNKQMKIYERKNIVSCKNKEYHDLPALAPTEIKKQENKSTNVSPTVIKLMEHKETKKQISQSLFFSSRVWQSDLIRLQTYKHYKWKWI